MPATGNQCHLKSGLEQATTDDRADRPGAEHHVTHPCSVPPAPWFDNEGGQEAARPWLHRRSRASAAMLTPGVSLADPSPDKNAHPTRHDRARVPALNAAWA